MPNITNVNNLKSMNNGNLLQIERPNQYDKNLFIKLLVTQITNQDPLNPMEGNEFLTQMVQLNSLDAINNINTGINNLINSFNSMVLFNVMNNSINLIGKKVITEDTIGYVKRVEIENNQIKLLLDNGSKIQYNQIKQIEG